MALTPYRPIQFNIGPIVPPRTLADDLSVIIDNIVKMRERERERERQDIFDALKVREAEQQLATAKAQEERAAAMFPLQKQAQELSVRGAQLAIGKQEREQMEDEAAGRIFQQFVQDQDPAKFVTDMMATGSIRNVDRAMQLSEKIAKQAIDLGDYESAAEVISATTGLNVNPADLQVLKPEYRDGIMYFFDRKGNLVKELETKAFHLEREKMMLDHRARMAQLAAAERAAAARAEDEKLSPQQKAILATVSNTLKDYSHELRAIRNAKTRIAGKKSAAEIAAVAGVDPVVASLLGGNFDPKAAAQALEMREREAMEAQKRAKGAVDIAAKFMGDDWRKAAYYAIGQSDEPPADVPNAKGRGTIGDVTPYAVQPMVDLPAAIPRKKPRIFGTPQFNPYEPHPASGTFQAMPLSGIWQPLSVYDMNPAFGQAVRNLPIISPGVSSYTPVHEPWLQNVRRQ